MLPEAKPFPRLICSRPTFIGGVKNEADQHGGTRRVGGSDSGTVFAGGTDGAGPYPQRVHGGYRVSVQARDARSSCWSTDQAFGLATRTQGVRRRCTEALIVIWEVSDQICGKQLSPLVPVMVEAMERHGHLRPAPAVRIRPDVRGGDLRLRRPASKCRLRRIATLRGLLR